MAPFKSSDFAPGALLKGRAGAALSSASKRANGLLEALIRRPEEEPEDQKERPRFRPVREGLVAVASAPIPAGVKNRTITTADGFQLRGAFWRPEGAARGTICLFQGRAEFIEKYWEVVDDLLKRGFAVATCDFRGQGGSERLTRNPMKGHVSDYGAYRLDAEAMMRDLAFASCPPPFFALAHSAAAPMAVALAARQPQWFERVVLAAPMIGLPLDRVEFFARGLATGLASIGFASAYIPGGGDKIMAMRPFEANRVTSDPARYAQAQAVIRAAPELALGSPTIGWLHSAFRAMTATAMPGVPESFRVPTLVLSAALDRIVDPRTSDRFAARIRGGGRLLVRASQHEIMMERDAVRDMFWAAFDAFVPGSRELA